MSVTLVSITQPDPSLTNAGVVHYTVTFSEAVTGVDASQFALASSGVSGASIASVTPVSGSGGTQYTVAVNTGTGDGTIALRLTGAEIHDLAGNGLPGGTFQQAVAYATGDSPFSVAVGDLNGDGRSDLVVTNGSSTSVSVLLGNGDGTFQPQSTYASGVTPSASPLVTSMATVRRPPCHEWDGFEYCLSAARQWRRHVPAAEHICDRRRPGEPRRRRCEWRRKRRSSRSKSNS